MKSSLLFLAAVLFSQAAWAITRSDARHFDVGDPKVATAMIPERS